MKSVICQSAPARAPAVSAARPHVAPPALPLVPGLFRKVASARAQQAAAFSLYAGEPQAQGPFSFIRPDCPPEGRSAMPVPKKPTAQAAAEAVLASEVLEAPRKERFRSALEQVSNYTNQSAMRHQ